MEVIRNYTHRTHGLIGSVTLVAPDGTWTLDGKELPESSVTHLVTFALQTLQDSYAGAENESDAKGAFGSKYDRLVAGTLGTRGGGTGADAFTLVARSITRVAMKESFGKDSADWKAFTGLSDADQLAKLDANFESNREVLTPAVEAEIARRAEKAKAKVGLAKKTTFKL